MFKAARSSYHNEGKKERQVAQLPTLKEEIAKKRLALQKGYEWPDEASRRSAGCKEAMWEASEPKIGGTPQEKQRFFEAVVAAHPECYWLEGRAPPTVRNHVISFRLKPDAKPVARQPIPVSPYDGMRVEYHIKENLAQGKLR